MTENNSDQPTPTTTPEVLERSAGQVLAQAGERLLDGGAATIGVLAAKDLYAKVVHRPPPSDKK